MQFFSPLSQAIAWLSLAGGGEDLSDSRYETLSVRVVPACQISRPSQNKVQSTYIPKGCSSCHRSVTNVTKNTPLVPDCLNKGFLSHTSTYKSRLHRYHKSIEMKDCQQSHLKIEIVTSTSSECHESSYTHPLPDSVILFQAIDSVIGVVS